MTFRLERDAHLPTHITVHLTSGALDVHITESSFYLRHIWSDLGKMLDDIDHEQNLVSATAEVTSDIWYEKQVAAIESSNAEIWADPDDDDWDDDEY
jgi:hypothetical protein